jgi:hypothetical protein
MRIALLTVLAAIATGAIGAVVAGQHWAFAWTALTMVGAVVVLGLAVLIAAMIWPDQKHKPIGHPVGL